MSVSVNHLWLQFGFFPWSPSVIFFEYLWRSLSGVQVLHKINLNGCYRQLQNKTKAAYERAYIPVPFLTIHIWWFSQTKAKIARHARWLSASGGQSATQPIAESARQSAAYRWLPSSRSLSWHHASAAHATRSGYRSAHSGFAGLAPPTAIT